MQELMLDRHRSFLSLLDSLNGIDFSKLQIDGKLLISYRDYANPSDNKSRYDGLVSALRREGICVRDNKDGAEYTEYGSWNLDPLVMKDLEWAIGLGVNLIVLVSGDKDYSQLVTKATELEIRTIIVANKGHSSRVYMDKQVASEFFCIEEVMGNHHLMKNS